MFATPSRMPKLLPWADWHEWSRCMQQLFAGQSVAQPPFSTTDAATHPLPLALFSSPPTFSPSDSAAQRDALDLVSVWRARGRLPLSVDLTAQLVLAQQADASTAAASFSFSELSSRQQYSLCVVRLVNGLVDANQSRAHAVSVNAIAAALSLPRLLVDARHEATHGLLPSLPLLRYAAAEALRYLHRHYWQRQEAASTALERQLTATLAQYQQAAKADDRQAAMHAVFALNISPSHLSALLVTALFSSSSPLLLLRPPAPLLPPPLSPAVVSRHFQHLLSVWDALLSFACQRIRGFRVDAVRQTVTGLVALTVEATREQAHAAQRTEDELQQQEEGEEERNAQREWQMALLVEWSQRLLSGLKDGQRDAAWLAPLASLAVQRNSSRTLAVGRQLMQQMRLPAASSPQWSLLTKTRLQRPQGDDDHATVSVSLEEMKAWCRQNANHSFSAAAVVAVPSSPSLQTGAELCSDWLSCPLGVLPHQSMPQLDDAVVRKRKREEQQQAEAAAAAATAQQQLAILTVDEPPEAAAAARVRLCCANWQLPEELSAAVSVLQRSIVTI